MLARDWYYTQRRQRGLDSAVASIYDRHVLDARVTQIQRVGVALAAVADDGDLLALDEVQVGVAIVVNTHGLLTPWAPLAAFVVVLLGSLSCPDKPHSGAWSGPNLSFRLMSTPARVVASMIVRARIPA